MPRAASRMEGGTDFKAARAAIMMVGKVIRVSTRTAHDGRTTRQTEKVDEHGQAEQTENDGRNRRQIIDVDFNQIRPFIDRSELFQINRRGDADGKRQKKRANQRKKRARERTINPEPVPAPANRRR